MIPGPIKSTPKPIQGVTVDSKQLDQESTESTTVPEITEEDLKNLISDFEDKKNELYILLEDWLPQREALIESLKEIADQCDKTHNNVNKANVAGGVAGVVGGGLGIAAVSLALAPVTAGLSVVIAGLGIAAASTSIAGGGIGVGANIVGPKLIKKLCEKADKLIDKDDIMTEKIQALFKEINKLGDTIKSLQTRGKTGIGLTSTLAYAGKVTNDILQIVNCAQAIKGVTTAAQTIDSIVDTAKVAVIAGSKTAVIFAAFGLALSITETAWYSKKLYQKEKSEAGMAFRKIAENLQQQTVKLREFKEACD